MDYPSLPDLHGTPLKKNNGPGSGPVCLYAFCFFLLQTPDLIHLWLVKCCAFMGAPAVQVALKGITRAEEALAAACRGRELELGEIGVQSSQKLCAYEIS